MPLISEYFKHSPIKAVHPEWPHGYKVETNLSPIENVFMGIEVEVENVRAWGDPLAVWVMKEDGSLRNGGREYVSIPLQGNDIPKALAYLFSHLNADIQFSHRTSIHIHMNVTNLTVEQIAGIIMVYLAVEGLLFKFVGHDRDKSIFCVPLFETELPNQLISKFIRSPNHLRMENARYAALNLDAIRKFGTLEFRHLFGTNDLVILMTWINLILSVYRFGTKHSVDELKREILPLNTNSQYISFVNEVFGPLVQVLDLTAVKFDLERGVKSVKASQLENSLYHRMVSRAHPNSELVEWKERYFAQGAYRQPRPAQAMPQVAAATGNVVFSDPFTNVIIEERNR